MDNFSKEEVEVVVVGACPSSIVVSTYCCAYLWKKKTYDRLQLHLSKDFCSLPFMPQATSSPKYLSKNEFIQYLDGYVEHFKIKPKFQTCVELAFYNNDEKKWNVKSRHVTSGEMEWYACDFLILATGENNGGYIPKVVGIDNFNGEIIHSSDYKFSEKYKDKKVLVVGSRNYGMEIVFDLSNYGCHTSIVIRSPVSFSISLYLVFTFIFFVFLHVNLPLSLVDIVIAKFAKFNFGNLAEFGIPQSEKGPCYVKISKGTSPVIDVGAIGKIKLEKIKVLLGMSEIKEHKVVFENGKEHQFDGHFCYWIQKCCYQMAKAISIFIDDGTLMNEFPNHWKGENRLYCAGFSKRGLAGISMDPITIVDDIKTVKGDKI
ncbi:hypothetical protein R3W88_019326 [Solanum pinnatisectum]|uniref:Flavin-containing monooxygenase n=1 Tax=Solanum pinnatisectum TaxID=50273 RepID=A0AAV9KLI7_9SOLN|nr:hypothetical protein R3W88_019326 [Solanum pinnatisectum]